MVSHHLLTPYLPIDTLPESERQAAFLLQTALRNLEAYVEDKRVGGGVQDFDAIKLLKYGAS